MAATMPNPNAKSRFHVPMEAYLIGIIGLGMAILLNHVYEGWAEAAANAHPDSSATNPNPGRISFTHNFTGDRLANSGWWDVQTASMNFCEEDYVFTPIMAEFINTISNFAYMYYAYTTWPKSSRWPPVTNISLFLVGLTSAIYHASLKHNAEIADQTGMYLLVASMDWYLYSYPGAIFSGKLSKPAFGAVLWGSCAGVVYMNFTASSADFGIHVILFVMLLTMLWPRCLYLIAQRLKAEKAGAMPPGAIKAGKLRKTFRFGALCFLLGFGVWLVDCAYCHELRVLREKLGLPLAWLTEMHGWWHVLTAIGAGVFVELTHVFSSQEHGNQIIEQGQHEMTSNGQGNGHLNGRANGHVKGNPKKLR